VSELATGTVFAGHRIEDVAGRGGMGVVYRAAQLALDRTVALKVIAPGLLDDGTMRARFVRESKVAASIDHPNVIPIYYAGDEGGIAYIAMRYVAGDDVRSLVRREGHLTPERAVRIVTQLGSEKARGLVCLVAARLVAEHDVEIVETAEAGEEGPERGDHAAFVRQQAEHVGVEREPADAEERSRDQRNRRDRHREAVTSRPRKYGCDGRAH